MFNDTQTAVLTTVAVGAFVTGAAVWSTIKTPSPILMPNANYERQSSVLNGNGSRKPEDIRISQFTKLSEVKLGDFGNIRTLYDIFQCGLHHGRNKPCLGYKPADSVDYKWLTYAEVDENSVRTGAGIIGRLQQLPGHTTMLGIFMKNCVEWAYIDQGCNRYSMVSVPLYDTLGEDACKFVINNVKCEVIFVDTKKKIDFLLGCRNELPHLKYLVMINDVPEDTVLLAQQKNIEIVSFSEILEYGTTHPVPLNLPKPTDTCTIFFTSGTTGTPKGCIIRHESIISGIGSTFMFVDTIKFNSKTEVHLSFLPLAHAYERLVHTIMFMVSGKIAFFSGDIRNLTDEFKVIQPTIVFAVPRLLNRIYDKVMMNLNSRPFWKFIFDKGLASKSAEVERGIIRRNSIWDFILFKRIQAILGGRVEIIMTSSAPVSEDIVKFYRAVMGCLVMEGYGQTETTGPCTITLPGDIEHGHVGALLPGTCIKLCDVPDMDVVVSRDGRGEICVKGDQCIKEYYNNVEMTQELIDSDGWLHTGDIGLWTERDQLRIVDRCKHLFKLSQGEYVAPEKLENIYSLSPLVAQIYVTGNSFKDICVAIVVPDLDGWNATGKAYSSLQEICDDKTSVEILLKNLDLVGRNNKLTGFEIVKRVLLWPQLLTPENGFLTPTLKLKRAEVSKYFKNYIDALYE